MIHWRRHALCVLKSVSALCAVVYIYILGWELHSVRTITEKFHPLPSKSSG